MARLLRTVRQSSCGGTNCPRCRLDLGLNQRALGALVGRQITGLYRSSTYGGKMTLVSRTLTKSMPSRIEQPALLREASLPIVARDTKSLKRERTMPTPSAWGTYHPTRSASQHGR
jgi:hypothetical protein